MRESDEGEGSVTVVRLALGWRAREVERRSSPGVQRFDDRDEGVIILEDEPSALAYADPAHALTLPPGRYLRVDQMAGRVYTASATPHLEALTPAAATALADSVARLLERAGWARVPGAGRGAAAVRQAAGFVASGARGTGLTDLGTWRVPRPQASWAALPPGTREPPGMWNGVEARISVRPLRSASADDPRLILQVELLDDLLGGELGEMVEARRRRLGGEMQTLRSWEEQPHEALSASR